MRSYRDKPLSPYAKYRKAPYRYSDEYSAWRREVLKTGSSDTDQARALHDDWREKFPLTGLDLSTQPNPTEGDEHVQLQA